MTCLLNHIQSRTISGNPRGAATPQNRTAIVAFSARPNRRIWERPVTPHGRPVALPSKVLAVGRSCSVVQIVVCSADGQRAGNAAAARGTSISSTSPVGVIRGQRLADRPGQQNNRTVDCADDTIRPDLILAVQRAAVGIALAGTGLIGGTAIAVKVAVRRSRASQLSGSAGRFSSRGVLDGRDTPASLAGNAGIHAATFHPEPDSAPEGSNRSLTSLFSDYRNEFPNDLVEMNGIEPSAS
jgi:hypothetical protein